MAEVRGGYVSPNQDTQDALEILALALDYAWDEATPASSYGIHVLLGAQKALIEKDRAGTHLGEHLMGEICKLFGRL